jgi:signal transduction histidine kinase
MKVPGFQQEQVEFLRKFGHELRTPLNSVITTTEMLLSDFYGELTAKQRAASERVMRNGDRLLHMIEGAMLYVRAISNAFDLQQTAISPAVLIQDTLAPFHERATAKGLALNFYNRLPEGFTVSTDADKLSVTIQNVLENALTYTAEGSITVNVDPAPDGGSGWQLKVTDTGFGISPDDMPSLFTPFWRSAEAKRRFPLGNGLGLVVSRELARLLGGALTVESTPAVGTVVTITFG